MDCCNQIRAHLFRDAVHRSHCDCAISLHLVDAFDHLAHAVNERRQRAEVRQLPRLRWTIAGVKGFVPGQERAVRSIDRFPAVNKVFDKCPEQSDFWRKIQRVRIRLKLFNTLSKVGALNLRVSPVLDRSRAAVEIALPLPWVIGTPACRF